MVRRELRKGRGIRFVKQDQGHDELPIELIVQEIHGPPFNKKVHFKVRGVPGIQSLCLEAGQKPFYLADKDIFVTIERYHPGKRTGRSILLSFGFGREYYYSIQRYDV